MSQRVEVYRIEAVPKQWWEDDWDTNYDVTYKLTGHAKNSVRLRAKDELDVLRLLPLLLNLRYGFTHCYCRLAEET